MSDEMDNVEWLRKSSSDEWCGSALSKCAAKITRLREEVERLKSEESCNDVLLEYAQAENQRLREENARLREALEGLQEIIARKYDIMQDVEVQK